MNKAEPSQEEVEIDGEWAPISRQVSGFAETDVAGVKRWVQVSSHNTREKDFGIQLQRNVYHSKEKKPVKVPQFWTKRDVHVFFTPDKPATYLAWRERRGHLYFKKITLPDNCPDSEILLAVDPVSEEKLIIEEGAEGHPLEYQSLTLNGEISQKLFSCILDAQKHDSIVGTPAPSPLSPGEQPLPELKENDVWVPLPPITTPPVMKKLPSKGHTGPPVNCNKGEGKPAPPKISILPKVGKLQKKLVKTNFVPPPPPVYE